MKQTRGGFLLGEMLQKHDLKQRAIVEATGRTQSTVSRWLNGAKPELPDRRALAKFARKYGVTISIDAWDEAVESSEAAA